MLCAALAAYPARATGALAILGAIGAASAVGALVLGSERLLPWAIGVLGVEYALSLLVGGGAGPNAAPLVAVGLLLVGELASWSISLRTRMREEPPVLLLRLWTLAGALVASLAVGAMLLALGATDVGGGVAWTAIGTASAVGAVLLVTRARAAG